MAALSVVRPTGRTRVLEIVGNGIVGGMESVVQRLVEGLPRERFRLVDGELLSWHGSRTPAGIDYAAEVLGLPVGAPGGAEPGG